MDFDFNFNDDPFAFDIDEQPEQQPEQLTSKQMMTNIDDILFGCGNSVNLTELGKALRQKYPCYKRIEYDIDINCLLKQIHLFTIGSQFHIILDHDVKIT